MTCARPERPLPPKPAAYKRRAVTPRDSHNLPEKGLGNAPICVAAFYRFARIADLAACRADLAQITRIHGVRGTILLAAEGINGTVAGSQEGIGEVLAVIRALPDCADLDVKFAAAETMPFHRMKVRLKREIVTMGVPELDPCSAAGTYVEPADWNALIAEPGTVLIDTRNEYEVACGSFAGAIDPQTASFSEFPAWFARERGTLLGSGEAPRKVAMFCTGGIRCEKATALLKAQGVEEVYHLKGGILRYLETIPAADSLWRGECFVFDQRVAVGQALAPGEHTLCFACRRPVSPEAARSPLYEAGVSCPACRGERSDAQRASYNERHRQELLAARNDRAHVGAVQDTR